MDFHVTCLFIIIGDMYVIGGGGGGGGGRLLGGTNLSKISKVNVGVT